MPFIRHSIAANYDANGAPLPEPEMRRASGDCLCDLCGREYRRHPFTFEYTDWNGEPFLHVLCNGDLVKL